MTSMTIDTANKKVPIDVAMMSIKINCIFENIDLGVQQCFGVVYHELTTL